MSASCQTSNDTTVTLLPREIRLVVERMLLLTALPIGMVPAVRDVLLYSAATGLGGMPALREDFSVLRSADPRVIEIADKTAGCATMAANGQHAWVALPLVLDALSELVTSHGSAALGISGALRPEELTIACAMGGRAGLRIFALRGGHGTMPGMEPLPEGDIVLVAAHGDAADPVLDRVLREGVATEAALWWELHHLSNTSLSADTPESRRHAGPVIVLEDGRIIGRSDHDDDTDISLLTEKAS